MTSTSSTLALAVHAREVQSRAQAAIDAYEAAHSNLRAMDLAAPVDTSDPVAVAFWKHMQDCLLAIADVSKLFWPPDKRNRSADRARLLDVFGVTDSSPLFDRDVRNNIQHIDARVDDWSRGDYPPVVLDYAIDSGDALEWVRQRLGSEGVFRWYTSKDDTVGFGSDELALGPCVDELRRLCLVTVQTP